MKSSQDPRPPNRRPQTLVVQPPTSPEQRPKTGDPIPASEPLVRSDTSTGANHEPPDERVCTAPISLNVHVLRLQIGALKCMAGTPGECPTEALHGQAGSV